MPRLLFLVAFLLLTTFAHAQVPNSITPKYDSLLKSKTTKLDSTSSRINNKIDSIQSKTTNILNPNFNQLTSKITSKQQALSDSIKSSQLQSTKQKLARKIDSLNQLHLPTEKYTRQLDSLTQLNPIKDIQGAVSNVEDRLTKPIRNAEDKVNNKLDVIRQEGGAQANIPGSVQTNIPKHDALVSKGLDTGLNTELSTDIKPDIKNPLATQSPELNNITQKASELKSVPQQQIDKVKSIDEIQSAQDKVSNLNQATDKVQAYGDDVKNITQGNLDEVKEIPQALEDKASNLDQLKELEKQNAELAKMKEFATQGNNPELVKEMAKKELVRARNHFEGKTEVLQAAMDKLAKLKQKYPDLKPGEIPKRRPNAMKGKPLVERILPGITLQILKETNFMIDLNPVVSYRFTGRINAGLGWNERLSFSKWNKLATQDRIYGPRVFGSYSIAKGFSAKAEVERMNAFIPAFAINPDAGSRQWLWSAFVGVKKTYKFLKKVNGNVQILYNLYDDHDSSPYTDRLNVRMGFEFPMTKRKTEMRLRSLKTRYEH